MVDPGTFFPAPGTGRHDRRNSPKGHERRPDLDHFYRHRASPIKPGDFEFEVTLTRLGVKLSSSSRHIPLDRGLTSIEYSDESAMLTGALTVKRPAPDVSAWGLKQADTVRLHTIWHQQPYRLWDMRITGVPDIDQGTGDVSADLADDLEALSRDEHDWEFRKSKDHPKQWRAGEVTRFVCHKLGVKMGQIAAGQTDLPNIKLKKGTGLEVIKQAYAADRKKSGVRYIIRFHNGELEVVPFRRPGIVYEVRGVATSSTTSGSMKGRPITIINATGHTSADNGKKANKITLTVTSDAARRRFGHVEADRDYGRVTGKDDLQKQAERDLALELRVKRTAQLNIPIIPFLRRGDIIHWLNAEPGWNGPSKGTLDRSYGYVTSVVHTINPAEAFSAIGLAQVDPYLADRQARDKAKRDTNRRQHHKPGSSSSDSESGGG